MKLTRIAVDNPVFATMMMVALVVLGLFSYRQLGVDQFPNIDFPVVVVTTDYPGASPETVESEVSRKIEEAVNTIAGIKTLTSRSLEGQSVVIIEFELRAVAGRRRTCARRSSMVRAAFRPEVKEPRILRFDPADQPIVSVAVRSDIRPVRELTTLADQISSSGWRTCAASAASRSSAASSARSTSTSIPAAWTRWASASTTSCGRCATRTRTSRPARPARQRRPHDRGQRAHRRARAASATSSSRAAAWPRSICARSPPWSTASRSCESLALLNGERALAVDVVKTQGANTIEVARGVRRAVAELQTALPPGVKLEIVRDSSRGIQNSVDNVQQTLIEGGCSPSPSCSCS